MIVGCARAATAGRREMVGSSDTAGVPPNSRAPECHGEGVTAVNRAAMKSNRAVMKSLILKRSIIIAGQKTSVSLEDEFWQALKQIAAGLDMPMAELVHQIGQQREYGNLSSALRLFVLEHYLEPAPRPSATPRWCKARSAHRPETAVVVSERLSAADRPAIYRPYILVAGRFCVHSGAIELAARVPRRAGGGLPSTSRSTRSPDHGRTGSKRVPEAGCGRDRPAQGGPARRGGSDLSRRAAHFARPRRHHAQSRRPCGRAGQARGRHRLFRRGDRRRAALRLGALQSRGRRCRRSASTRDAIQSFARVCALEPEHYDAHRALGFLWLARRRARPRARSFRAHL